MYYYDVKFLEIINRICRVSYNMEVHQPDHVAGNGR